MEAIAQCTQVSRKKKHYQLNTSVFSTKWSSLLTQDNKILVVI